MYGTSRAEFPRRIVCLTSETAEIAFLLDAGDRVVGVPGTARRPAAALERARVGGFTTFKLDKILALEPDLVLAFSDLQRDIVRDLIGAGVTVLCTNQRSFDEVLNAVLLIGGALGCEEGARDLIRDMQDELRQVREYSAAWPDRPRVHRGARGRRRARSPDHSRVVVRQAGRRGADREPPRMGSHHGGEEQPN